MKLPVLLLVILSGIGAVCAAPIHREEEILVGGIRQYITINGNDESRPLLLFLHGGPGGSVMHYADRFTNKLQEHFVVVQWDQRETGRTLELNSSPVPVTLDVCHADTYELITILLKRFGREKLFLAGHSWGTALGFQVARLHPELLFAWIAIGPMVNQAESERVALSIMREGALRTGDVGALESLSKVHVPFETGEQLYYHRKGLLALSGSHRQLSLEYVEKWSERWLSLFNEASREDLSISLPLVHCPVYIFAGRSDYQTNSLIAERYYQQLVAPRKGFFWFERSAHGIPTSEPELMQQIIIGKILPETFPLQQRRVVVK